MVSTAPIGHEAHQQPLSHHLSSPDNQTRLPDRLYRSGDRAFPSARCVHGLVKTGDIVVNRPIAGGLLVAAVALTGACSDAQNGHPVQAGQASGSATSPTATAVHSSLGRPLPPQHPCVFPGSAELSALKASSAAVVEGTFAAPGTAGGQLLDFTITKVLVGEPSSQHVAVSWSASDSRSPKHILAAGGSYVLFGSPAGAGAYFPSEGAAGIFEIGGGGVLRHCVNYVDPTSPLTASGTGEGEPLATFEKQVIAA